MSALFKASAVEASDERRFSHGQDAPATAPSSADEERRARERDAHAAQQSAELARLKDEARAAGLVEARKQAAEEARKAIETQLKRISGLMADMQQAWDQERARTERLLADLAFVAVGRVLTDAMARPEAIIHVVHQALDSCADWRQLTLEVHPADVAVLQAALSVEPSEAAQRIKIEPSKSVTLGGCRLKSDEGVLDARLETQLAALRAHFDQAKAAR
jgi:flagellar assembly protein FliH